MLGAGEAPGGVRAEAESSTEISVQWSGLSTCRLVNGNIIKYRVRFRVSCGDETGEMETEGDWKEGGRVVLTGLIPLSNYSISVAALNQNGDVGPYSDPVTERTQNYCKQQENTFYILYTSSLTASNCGEQLGAAPIAVGVVVGLVIGVAVGISGLIGGAFIAKRRWCAT